MRVPASSASTHKSRLSTLSPTSGMSFLEGCQLAHQLQNGSISSKGHKRSKLLSTITIIKLYKLYCLHISSHLILRTVLTCVIIPMLWKRNRGSENLDDLLVVIPLPSDRLEPNPVWFPWHGIRGVNTSRSLCQQMTLRHIVGQGHSQVIPQSFSSF